MLLMLILADQFHPHRIFSRAIGLGVWYALRCGESNRPSGRSRPPSPKNKLRDELALVLDECQKRTN